MKNPRLRLWPLLLFAGCALLCACSGPDPVRIRAERDSWALAKRCANGWFGDLPASAHDQALVLQALDDWDARLKSDERLLASPLGGAGR